MICPKCGVYRKQLTRDHVCPQWLLQCAKNLGIEVLSPLEVKGGVTINKNIKMLCGDCNRAKGHILDTKDKFTRTVLREIKKNITNKLSKKKIVPKTLQQIIEEF